MASVTDSLLRATLAALHAVLWVRDTSSWILLWLWSSVTYSLKHKGEKLECIAADMRDLKKVPQHLAVVVQEEEVSSDDLALIATWAFASHVHVVSFYDPYGNIMREIVPLRNRIQYYHQQMFSPPIPDIQVCTTAEMSSLPVEWAGDDQGVQRVVILCGEDGHQSLVQTAMGVSQAVLGREVDMEQVDTTMVNQRLANSLGFPDPEVAVVFGSTCSTLGYPPWKLRLTEIHTIPTHHKVQYQRLLQVLERYSSCKQRCGK